MATRRYKISAGETYNQITEEVGAATNSDAIELTVDLAATGMTTHEGKNRVLLALDMLKAHIIKGNWPPA